jgi:hypothetical protein
MPLVMYHIPVRWVWEEKKETPMVPPHVPSNPSPFLIAPIMPLSPDDVTLLA